MSRRPRKLFRGEPSQAQEITTAKISRKSNTGSNNEATVGTTNACLTLLTILKLCLGTEQRMGHQASVAVLLCGCLCCLLDFDIQWVPLHAEGSSLEQNRLLQVYLLSEMGSCVENRDLSSQLAEQVVIFTEHR
jgi:hypothetical protein